VIQKLSISLPQALCEFIEHYQREQGLSSRSEVLARALRLLQEQALEASYQQANKDYDSRLDLLVGD
jgi:metal-responsive CopG/Arc/MetJ family transcriptional regulator